MGVDLFAGLTSAALPPLGRPPKILTFDSGLGGLTVLAELTAALPGAAHVYAADDAAFPYGALSDEALVARVVDVMRRLILSETPDLIVVACNTASTLALPALRAAFRKPFVGTVPAIKPAVAATRSGLVTVLATPGTVRREHTRAMVETFAGNARVTLVGSARLAGFAEAELRGAAISDAAILEEIAPCFVQEGARRTDAVALACTHFPLLTHRFQRLAPWPVAWIDPAPAVARRVLALIHAEDRARHDGGRRRALFTSGIAPGEALSFALADRGLEAVFEEPIPFD